MSTNRGTDLVSECLKAWYGQEGSTENDREGMALVIGLVRKHDAPALRDQFAMHAVSGQLANRWQDQYSDSEKAARAYLIADAMLAARGGSNG